MCPPTTSCSERPASEPAQLGRLIVLEGMPGAGKSTAIAALSVHGQVTIGEYTTGSGVTIPPGCHPAPADEQSHQGNWLTKHHLTTAARAPGGPVICDRDWISSLAFAASLDDGGALLRERAAWARAHLEHGQLACADVYVVLHIDAPTSLTRRAGRLTPAHPWSTLAGLEHLIDFYTDPPHAVHAYEPALAEQLSTCTWAHLHAPDRATILDQLRTHTSHSERLTR